MTTRRRHDLLAAPDLVDREFEAAQPARLWVADITYVARPPGFSTSQCAGRLEPTRGGWAMVTHLRTNFVLDAPDMALHWRQPERVIHHGDQGT